MEDVLASIRRAIDENAQGSAPDRFGGSMAELRVKFDAPQETRARGDYDYPSTAGSPETQGFAGILGGKRGFGETGQRRPDPALSQPEDEGQHMYDGYYGAQLEDYQEPSPEPYQTSQPMTPPRYLPPPPAVIPDHRQSFAQDEGLLSEASGAATQAAFNRLAETITRRALGERPIADVAQELLRGMLKQWLDDNLPKIVERLVREEIEWVVRRPQR